MKLDGFFAIANLNLDFADEVVDDLCKIGAVNLKGNLSCEACRRGFLADVKLKNLSVRLADLGNVNDYRNLAGVVNLLEDCVNRSDEVAGNGFDSLVANEVEDICKFFKERCNRLVADILDEADEGFKNGLNC